MFRAEDNIIRTFDESLTILFAILELLGFLHARNTPGVATDTEQCEIFPLYGCLCVYYWVCHFNPSELFNFFELRSSGVNRSGTEPAE